MRCSPPGLLDLLRDWYRIARPTVWLFPGRDPMLPMTTRQFNRAVHTAAGMAVELRRSSNSARRRIQQRSFFAEQSDTSDGFKT